MKKIYAQHWTSVIKKYFIMLSFLISFFLPGYSEQGFVPDCTPDVGIPIPAGFPNEYTTGPIGAGLSYSDLTPYTGTYTVSNKNGFVVENMDITGTIAIYNSSNVTIRRCRVTGAGQVCIIATQETCSNITLEDCEVISTTEGTANVVGKQWGSLDGFTVRRCNLSGGADGLKIISNTTVEDCYIHHLMRWYTPSTDDWTHNDCVQSLGGHDISITGNTFLAPYKMANAVFQCAAHVEDIYDMVFEGNYISGGANAMNFRETNYDILGIEFKNNVFQDDSYKYGPLVVYGNVTVECNSFVSGGTCDAITGKCINNTVPCSGNIAVTGVDLQQNSLSIDVGQSSTLTAVVSPSNATDKSVSWSSSNNSIASVSANGVVSALSGGQTTITVTTNNGNYTDNCIVTVQEVVPQNNYTATVNNFSRDRTMFDSDMARGNNNAAVGLSGTSNAPWGTKIMARAVSTDDGGATTTAWREIATVQSGSWSGVLNTPRSSSWYKAEVKVKESTQAAVQTGNRFGVGLIIFHSGQSNYERVTNMTGDATPIPIGNNGDNFQMWHIINRGSVTGSDEYSTIEGPLYITDSYARTVALRAMAAYYHKHAPGLKVMALFDVKPGRTQEMTLKDSDVSRTWTSIQKLFGKGAWEGTGPMADGQELGIFIQGHVNDINEDLFAEWYMATCLGKYLDGSDIPGISLTEGFPTTDVFANVGGWWQDLWINHVWPEAIPTILTGRTQIQLKEPGAAYVTNTYPYAYDKRRIAREKLENMYPQHFHWANDYPILKRYDYNGLNSSHFDVDRIYGSPLKGESLAVSVLRQIGAISFDRVHFDIITKTSTYIELGSSAGPVTTIARAQGDNTNFTTELNPVGAVGLSEVLGFQYADFKQPTRVEIVDNNGNRASSGKVRVYLDPGYTDLYYAMGGAGLPSGSWAFNQALFMRHMAIVDVGLHGDGVMDYGVWVEPYTDREFINDGIPNIAVTGVSLSADLLNMTVGQTIKLNAIISPANASNKNVDWTSANASIATVDQYGNVTANVIGTTTITVTTDDGNYTDVCSVTVATSSSSQSAYAVNSLPGRIQVEDYDNGGEGIAFHDVDEKKLDLTIRPSDNVDIEATTDVDGVNNIGWVSDGEWLEYNLENVASGNYTIDARASSNHASPGNIVIKLGDGPDGTNFATIASIPVSNTGSWENWQTFTATDINISGGSNKVLRIEMDGGGYDINWIEFSAEKVPTSITLDQTTADLIIGGTLQLNETVLPTDAVDKTVTWSSSNASVAIVDANGAVSALSGGQTTITATTNTGGLTASCTINVALPQSAYAVNSIPGRIQVEDYDFGGEGIAFHDVDEKKLDLTIRPDDNVDIEATTDVDGTYNLGWMSDGEWLEYNLENIASGNYTIDARASSAQASPGNIVIKLGDGPDGANFTTIASIAVSNTGSWENWQTFTASNISINGGSDKVLRIEMDGGGYDMNWLEFSAEIITPTDITLNQATDDLLVGETVQLTETVLPADAADKTVTWSSSNSSVATVDANGLVSALSGGIATITATTNTGGLTASCTINVTVPQPLQSAYAVNSLPGRIQIEDYDLGGEGIAFHDAEEKKLDLTIRPDDNVDLEITSDVDGVYNMGWSSDGEWLEYTLTDVAAGNYSISARAASGIASPGDIIIKLGDGPDGDNFVTIATVPISGTGGWENWQTFTVNDISIDAGTNKVLRFQFDVAGYDLNWIEFTAESTPTDITLDPTSAELHVGESVQVNETVLPADAVDKTVTWSSSNASVATVDANGLVSAVALGTATITATTNTGGLTAVSSINVTPISVTGVTLDQTSLSLNIGENTDLTETVSPYNATDNSVSWSSSNSAVATVDANGVVSALSGGQTTIVVTTNDGGYTDQCTVTVSSGSAVPTNVALNKPVTVSDENLPYDPKERLVDGDSLLYWAASGFPQWAEVDLQGNYDLSSIRLITHMDRDYQYIIEAKTEGGSYTTIVDRSANTEGTNLIDAVNITARYVKISVSGAATYTGTWCSLKELIVMGVEAQTIPVKGITLSSSALTLDEGQASQLTETVSPADATDKSVTWSTSNAAVATVDANGVVSALDAGQAIITATTNEGGYTAQCTVTVNEHIPVLSNVALNKPVTVSDENLPYDPKEELVDGDALSYWAASGFPQWAEVDLQGSYDLYSIQLITHLDRDYQYIIEAKQAGGSYVTIVDRSSNTESTSLIDDVSFSSAVSVKITITGANTYTGTWCSLKELIVNGESSIYQKKLAPKADAQLSLAQANVQVYPNPVVDGRLNVILEGFTSGNETMISIYDLSGRKISENRLGISEQTISLNLDNVTTKKGIYFVRVSDGVNNIVRKIVIQ